MTVDPGLMRDCVAEVAGLDPALVDFKRTFADLGVESFAALRLRALLAQRTGAWLPLTTFLGDRTPAEAMRAEGTPLAEASAETVASATDAVELTPIQAAYWTGRGTDFALGGVATFWYHEYDRTPEHRGATSVEADIDRLEAAWRTLVAHHPMLRTVIGRDGRQRVLSDVAPYTFDRTDLRAASPDEIERALAALRVQRSHQVRDAAEWPLFDAHVVLLPRDIVRVFTGFDVLVLDFASWRLLLAQWEQLVADPGTSLPSAPVTFHDIVHRRAHDPAHQTRRCADRAYWQDRLGRLPDGPRLPLTAAPERITAPTFVRRVRPLSAEEWSALRERAARHGVSPTATVLATFALALGRWGATEPFCLNATLFDRPEDLPGVEHLVGDFTTSALIEIAHPNPPNFAEFARTVNETFWEAIDHRAYSGVEVLRDLTERRGDTGKAASHPVVFTSGLGMGSDTAPGSWLGEEVFGVSQTPQVLLDHLVWEEGGTLKLVWDAVEEAFDPEWLDGLADAQVRALRSLATRPEAWTDPGFGWDPTFRRRQPLDITPFPDSGPLLDDPLRATADRTPDEVALLTDGQAITHGELAERADALGAHLAASGAKPGALVLVALPKGPAQIVATLGVMRSGAGYVPVDPAWPAARIAAVCERASVHHAVVSNQHRVALPAGVDATILEAESGRLADTSVAFPTGSSPAAVTDLAYAIFTSGSTGTPKGVAIEHSAARTTIDDITDRFTVTADDRVLGLSALSFDLSVYDIFGVLGAGGALVLPDANRQRDPQHWCELIGRHRVTVWNTAPALLEMLVEYAEVDTTAAALLGTVRLVLLSGDWIPVTLPDRFRALVPGAAVMSLGGATEASIWSLTYPIGDVDPAWPSIPYGRPLRDQSFYVLDEHGAPCPVGVPGGLFIAGGGLARGYLGDPDQSARRFAVHPVLGERLYDTGDLGRWRPDGNLQFLGRSDRQVKVHGHRIELGEIEAVLGRLPQIRQAVASALPGPDGRPRLVAHVAFTGDGPAISDESDGLAGALRDRLPDYMIPSRFVVLHEFPVTENGKVDYGALPSPFDRSSPPPVETTSVPAAPPLQPGPIADAVRDILGATVDSRAALVEAGATSLDVIRLANVIEDITGTRPSFADLAAFDSVADLVETYQDRPQATPAAVTSEFPMPPTMNLALRLTVPERAEAADSLEQAGSWVREVRQWAERVGYHTTETLLPGDAALVEIRLERPPTPAARPLPEIQLERPPRTAAGPFPLTEMQLAYLVGRADTWLGDQVAPHYYTEADIDDLDVNRLAAALRLVVMRHPMLRAVITPDTMQVVRTTVSDVDIHVTDLRALEPAAKDAELARLRTELSHRVLDPAGWPMFHLSVTRLAERDWRVHFGLDLLFCDAQSAMILAGELATAYRDPSLLPAAPTIGFVEWVRRQQAAADSEQHLRSRDYWRRIAARLPDGPQLPITVPGPDNVRFNRRRHVLDAARWSAVCRTAGEHGVTPAGLLLTAFGEALRAGGGGDRVTLVVTTFDRPPEHDGVIGDYTSTLLLEVDSAATTFRERAQALQRNLWSGLEHATGPAGVHGNEVLRELTARRGQQVLLPVVFSSGLGSTRTKDGRSADASQLLDGFGRTAYAISQTPHVVLDHQVFEVDGELRTNWDAVDAAFPDGYLDELFTSYTALLQGLGDPAEWDRTKSIRQIRTAWPRSPSVVPRAAPVIGHADLVLETRVAAVFGTLLGTDPATLDPARSFFELGATSLTLVQAHARLRTDLAVELSVLDLFAHPSIRALAAHLTGPQPASASSEKDQDAVIDDPLLATAKARGNRRLDAHGRDGSPLRRSTPRRMSVS